MRVIGDTEVAVRNTSPEIEAKSDEKDSPNIGWQFAYRYAGKIRGIACGSLWDVDESPRSLPAPWNSVNSWAME